MDKTQEGPQTRVTPEHRQRVCGDCKYHVVQHWKCGHDEVTNNYSCTHPDVASGARISPFTKGCEIAFNSRETPSTPKWCPFIQPTKPKDNA